MTPSVLATYMSNQKRGQSKSSFCYWLLVIGYWLLVTGQLVAQY